jgi:hypothetical protein
MAICIIATLDPLLMDNYFFLAGFIAAAMVTTYLMGTVAYYAAQLAMCQ